MTALVTCAHAGPLLWFLWARGGHVKSIAKRRRDRMLECSESLDALVAHRNLFTCIYVLECVARRVPSYIKRRSDCLTAVSRNSLPCSNKGIQEFVNIGNFLAKADIPDEELIVKLTARYLLQKPDFLVCAASSQQAVIVRKDSDVWGERGKGVHTFLFAAQKSVLVSFALWLLDIDRYKNFGMAPIEWVFGDYLAASGHNIMYYPERLHVVARYSPPLTHMIV